MLHSELEGPELEPESNMGLRKKFINVLFFFSFSAEMGDYDDVADRDFLRMHKFLPYQEKVHERIMELHCRHQYVSFSFVSFCFIHSHPHI